MTPDLQLEFRLLSERARQSLREVPECGSYRHVFSIWVLPSFSPSSRWTVYSPLPSRQKLPFASHTIWQSDIDLEKFRSPTDRLRYPKDLVPTFQEEVAWLSPVTIEKFCEKIRCIAIPIFLAQPSIAGCDGTRFEFRYDQLFFGAQMHWWEDQPQEWRSFTSTVAQIVAELTAAPKESPQKN